MKQPAPFHPAARLLSLGLLLTSTWAALAHNGEDHSEAAPVPAATSPAQAPLPEALVAAQRLPDGSLWIPKAVQHRLGLLTLLTQHTRHPVAVELEGRVLADPASSGRVQASQTGRIEAAGAGGLPWPGQVVRQGQLLARLRPLPGSLERGNQQAALEELTGQLALAERQLTRAEQLDGVLPRKEIEAARLARDTLARRREAVATSLQAAEELRAPVSGVLAGTPLAPGQVVEARELLFEVIDPRHLMVEALAHDVALTRQRGAASAALPDGRQVELQFLGASPQWREQALPLLFRVRPDAAPVLAVGQLLKVSVQSGQPVDGVALPRSALDRSPGGETRVWVHTEAERFVPRIVTSQPLDAQRVVVSRGLQARERVLVTGASLLGQWR